MEDFFSPKVIMSDPEAMKRLAEVYLEDPDPTNVPTPAGLARALGFSSAQVMVNALSLKDPAITDYSRHILAQALTLLEDKLVRLALTKATDASMTKFVLSARMGMSEKRETTINETSQKTIKIITATSEPIDAIELDEVLRLETAISQQNDAERAALTGAESIKATQSTPDTKKRLDKAGKKGIEALI